MSTCDSHSSAHPVEPPLPIANSGKRLARWSIGSQYLVVHQDADYRWLYFADEPSDSASPETAQIPIQSIMRLSRPAELVLPYMQRMVAWLAAFPVCQALNIIQFGLGGGAIARWLAQLPAAHRLISVDSSAAVIRCYQQYFCPEDNAHGHCGSHAIVEADAAEYLAAVRPASCDLALLDLFDSTCEGGLPRSIVSVNFAQMLFDSLTERGLAVINVAHGRHQSAQVLCRNLRLQGGSLCLMSVPGFENLIIVAGRKPPSTPASTPISMLDPHLQLDVDAVLSEIIVVDDSTLK